LSTTGLLGGCEPRLIERWIDSACAGGLIAVSADQYRTLALTPLGREVMAGRADDVRMNVPRAPGAATTRRRTRGMRRLDAGRRTATVGAVSPPSSRPDPAVNAPVVEALRAWRLEEARRRAIAPFVILHDRTLAAIAAALPRSPAELEAISGIGSAKLAAYGDAILSVVGSAALERKRSS